MKFFNINTVYREGAGEEEAAVPGTPPATPPVEAPPPDAGNDRVEPDENLWVQLSNEVDDDDLPVDDVSPSPEPPPEVPPAVEEPPPPAEPLAEEPPAETPPVEPAAETPPEPQPTQQTPEVPPETPHPTEEELAVKDKQNREQMQDAFKKHYNLTDDEKLRLVTEPGTIVDLQSRMMTDFWFGMQKWIETQMPQMVQQNIQVVEKQNEHVDDFFKAWPKLNRKAHGKTVSEVARTYAQVNPGASPEEVTRFVGMQTMLLHNIPPELTPVGDVPPAETPPAAPATPAPAPVAPYQPAAVNASTAQQSQSGNIWENMAEELLEDDSDF